MNRFQPLLRWAILVVVGLGLTQSLPVPSSGAAPQATVITLWGGRILNAGLTTADFNGDGYKEIVAGGGDGILYVVSTSDGVTWNSVWSRNVNDDILAANPPWPKTTNELYSTPAIADLDNDGHLDIVVAVGGDIHVEDVNQRENGGVLVYRYDSPWQFSLIEPLSADGKRGWPQPRIDRVGAHPGFGQPDGLWDGIITAPALGDLDGDGDLEIVVEGIDRRLWAWHHTGELVAGWPIYRYDENGQDNNDNLLRGGLASPALGDIDGDGLPEAIFGTMSPYWDRVHDPDYTKTATLWAINHDSSNVPGFPVIAEQIIHSSPALGDIDGDGQLEIVHAVGWGASAGRTNLMYAWNGDSSPVPNWNPLATASTSEYLAAPPALGDIDNDGELEIVIGCGNTYDLNSCGVGTARLYAWNGDGSPVTGFPKLPPSPNNWMSGSYAMPYSPILADIDGDGQAEILVVHMAAWGITVVDAVSGEMDNTSHLFYGGLFAPPLVDDVDNDGKLEILAGGGESDSLTSHAVIRIWDEQGSVNSYLPWPMYRHDVRRTGLIKSPRLVFPGSLYFMHQQGSGSTETLDVVLRNESDTPFDWNITNPIPILQVNPSSGTVYTQTTIRFTVNTATAPAGWSNLGNLTVSGTSSGRPVQGSPLTVPVRLYVGDVRRIYLPVVVRRF